jgi:UDP-glucose 4-epimerase
MTTPRIALVTGGAGFIGSHLVSRLVQEGYRVRVLDNLLTGRTENLADVIRDIEFVHGDLRRERDCLRAVRGAAIAFHVAALPSVPRSIADPWTTHDVNVNGTVRLLLACRDERVRRVVYSSSSSAYGDNEALPRAESHEPLPRSPYAAAKLAAEHYVLSFARAALLEAVALRYFNVFGPRQDPDSPYAAVIPAFLSAAYQNRPATVFGDGAQTRDFTYVTNVVDANLLAASPAATRANGQVVNVGAGGRTSILQLLAAVREITGRTLAIERRPPREGDLKDSQACLKRAAALLGYHPRVGLRDGLRLTWEWYTETRAAQESTLRAAGTG